jgi:Flp pilus assembly protein TadD
MPSPDDKPRISPEKLREIRVDTHVTYGKEFLRAGRYEDACTAFDKALEIDAGEIRALAGRSLALTRLGRHDEALAAAAEIFRLEPNNPYGYNAQAVAYHAMGLAAEAEQAFVKALEFGPDNAAHYYNFACFWAARDEPERCRENLAQALERDSRLNVLAATDVDMRKFREEAWFQKLVAFHPPEEP